MIGYAHPAGDNNGVRTDIEQIASYFSVNANGLTKAALHAESAEHAEIVLLQNPTKEAKVQAAAIYSSAWSRSYLKGGNPYGAVWRDFHYQVMFSSIAALVETGCDRIRMDNPVPGQLWRRDAYVCLLEATQNIKRYMNTDVLVFLQEGSYAASMPTEVDQDKTQFRLNDHRPVGISPHIFGSLNLRTVFIEKNAPSTDEHKRTFNA
jgi:hypothetical protein